MRFVLKTRYGQDLDHFKHNGQRLWYGLLGAVVLALPIALSILHLDYFVGELTFVYIYAVAGVGLMLLVGYTGQVSLGHAAFLAIGAYAHVYFLKSGLPFAVSILCAGFLTAIVGGVIAIPALRMTGIYLAVATLAFSRIVEQVVGHWDSVTGGHRGTSVPDVNFFGISIFEPLVLHFVVLVILVFILVGALNLLRSPTGRAMIAVRDSEIYAQAMGISLDSVKTTAFAISAGISGIAGALLAHHSGYVTPETFTILLSIELLLMVVVGGLGSMQGVFYGAIFVVLLPTIIAFVRDYLPDDVGQMPGLQPGLFGLILVLFLVFEPLGIYGRWLKIRQFFSEFPLYRNATHKRQKSYLRTERVR